jgi:hypothetical protein
MIVGRYTWPVQSDSSTETRNPTVIEPISRFRVLSPARITPWILALTDFGRARVTFFVGLVQIGSVRGNTLLFAPRGREGVSRGRKPPVMRAL